MTWVKGKSGNPSGLSTRMRKYVERIRETACDCFDRNEFEKWKQEDYRGYIDFVAKILPRISENYNENNNRGTDKILVISKAEKLEEKNPIDIEVVENKKELPDTVNEK